MEENNTEQTNTVSPLTNNIVEETKTKKPSFFLIILFIVILILALFITLTPKKDLNKDLNTTIELIDTSFNETQDIEYQLLDLPEDYLTSESSNTNDIDNSINLIDEQLEELDNIENEMNISNDALGL